MNYPFRLGQKIYLRALDEDDIEHCLRWFNDPLITRHLESGRVPLDRKSQIEHMDVCFEQLEPWTIFRESKLNMLQTAIGLLVDVTHNRIQIWIQVYLICDQP